MTKRCFDILFSLIGLIFISPLLILVAIFIKLDSPGPVFFRQVRVGKNEKEFRIFKFRSMYIDSDKRGPLITVGDRDPRITKMGAIVRKYKIDELPQLINVLLGDMSFVGPRPEVSKYTNLYNSTQKRVLSVRPGITDPASIAFRNENQLLEGAADPEKKYIEELMPQKVALSLEYIDRRNLFSDVVIILKTLKVL